MALWNVCSLDSGVCVDGGGGWCGWWWSRWWVVPIFFLEHPIIYSFRVEDLSLFPGLFSVDPRGFSLFFDKIFLHRPFPSPPPSRFVNHILVDCCYSVSQPLFFFSRKVVIHRSHIQKRKALRREEEWTNEDCTARVEVEI